MSVGKQLLFSVLTADPVSARGDLLTRLQDSGVSEQMFASEDEASAYRFMVDYRRRYGVCPSIALVEVETEIRFPNYASQHPFDYWFDEFRKFVKHGIVLELMAMVEDYLVDGRVDFAIDCIGNAHSGLIDLMAERKSVSTLSEMAHGILEKHDLLQRGLLNEGIYTGFPYIDHVTGGAQPGDTWVIAGESGSGKCLGKGTPVIMYDGSIKKVEDIKAGELLMGPDSKPRVVLSLARGREEMFRITPTKGMPYVVNRSHILSLRNNNQRAIRTGKQIVNISVNDWLQQNKTFKKNYCTWRTGVDFPVSADLPNDLPPYILGLWLGDGIATYPRVTTADEEIVAEITNFAQSISLWCLPLDKSGKSRTWGITTNEKGRKNRFLTALQDMNLIGNKHIPEMYLTASRRDRLELLAGLLDTDGSLASNGTSYEITQKRKILAENICFLARSLGFGANMHDAVKTCTNNGKRGTYYRVHIYGDCSEIPTRLDRKKAKKCSDITKCKALSAGITVESLGEGDYYGFEISGPDRLFMLGDFTVTHNTYVLCRCAMSAVESGKKCLFVSMEMPNAQVGRRSMAMGAAVNAGNLRLGRLSRFGVDQVREFLRSWDDGRNSRLIFVEGLVSYSVNDVKSKVKEHKPDVVFIDGAYMLRGTGHNKARWEMNMEVMEALKQFAMTENIAIISTFQFDQKQKLKSLATIMGGQAVGQLASVVIGIENEESSSTFSPVTYKELTLYKGREGETGKIRLKYDMNRTSIEQDSVIEGQREIEDLATQFEETEIF